jgi:hypothetical protein
LVGTYDIEFIEADAPITDPTTKFGGQPVRGVYYLRGWRELEVSVAVLLIGEADDS